MRRLLLPLSLLLLVLISTNLNAQAKFAIYGSGDVTYRGTPRISQRILGSGTVSAD